MNAVLLETLENTLGAKVNPAVLSRSMARAAGYACRSPDRRVFLLEKLQSSCD
jgi:hypothetical protein